MISTLSKNNFPHQVSVSSTGRLHMGFFDLNGVIGRKFGSIGLSLAEPVMSLVVSKVTSQNQINLPTQQNSDLEKKLNQLTFDFQQAWQLSSPIKVEVTSTLPRHAGLGSGTQLALTLGAAITRLFDLPYTTSDVALTADRGGRSGIGIAAFDQGGLLIDGGQRVSSTNQQVPPLLARYAFPERWRVLLIFDESDLGVHGATEASAFKTLPEFPNDQAAHLCHEVLMKAMPALVEEDLIAFGESIQELQAVTGDHFAPVQGGRYASKHVADALNVLASNGVACFGQSSWGPTGFAIVESEAVANELMGKLTSQFSDAPIRMQITQANNKGAQISAVN